MTHEMGINDAFSMVARLFAPKLLAIVAVSKAVENNMRKRGLDLPHYIVDPTSETVC